MKTVKVQPLTQESFSKYGSFENLYQPQTMGVGVGTDNAFYAARPRGRRRHRAGR